MLLILLLPFEYTMLPVYCFTAEQQKDKRYPFHTVLIVWHQNFERNINGSPGVKTSCRFKVLFSDRSSCRKINEFARQRSQYLYLFQTVRKISMPPS